MIECGHPIPDARWTGPDGERVFCTVCHQVRRVLQEKSNESARWEVVISFDADNEDEAKRIVLMLAKRLEGDEHDTNVRAFTLKAVEYL